MSSLTLPPGPRQSTLRQLVRYSTDPIPFLEECHARYGDVFTTRLPGLPPIVNFAKADAARDVFTAPDGATMAGDSAVPFEFLIGKSALIALDGARHKRERKMMMPAVHGERLAGFGSEMSQVAEEVLSTFRTGQSLAIDPIMQKITAQVILRTVFGVRGDHPLRDLLVEFLTLAGTPVVTMISILAGGDRFRRSLATHYASAVDRVERLRGPFSGLPLGRLAKCARELDEIWQAEIRARRTSAAGRKDVMSLLLTAVDENGQGMSDSDVRDEMMTLLFAGYETTATTLSWAMGLILTYPSVLANLRAEWARVGGPSGAIEPARAAELKYTDAVLRETLRLYPAGTGVIRRLKQPMTIGGVSLPAEVMLLPQAYLVHRDPALWPDPLKFDPTRFVDKKPKPHEWFPFGGGARTCLGMAFALYEMKLVLPRLFQQHDFKLEEPLPGVKPKAFLLGPERPIRVRVEALREVERAPEAAVA